MKKTQLLLVLILISATSLSNCSKGDDNSPVIIAQAVLDAVSRYIGSWTGGQMAHGGPEGMFADSTVCEAYANNDLSGTIHIRTIIPEAVITNIIRIPNDGSVD